MRDCFVFFPGAPAPLGLWKVSQPPSLLLTIVGLVIPSWPDVTLCTSRALSPGEHIPPISLEALYIHMGSSYYFCFEIRKTRLSQEDTKRELAPQAHVAGKARPGERRRAKEFPEHYFLAPVLPPGRDHRAGSRCKGERWIFALRKWWQNPSWCEPRTPPYRSVGLMFQNGRWITNFLFIFRVSATATLGARFSNTFPCILDTGHAVSFHWVSGLDVLLVKRLCSLWMSNPLTRPDSIIPDQAVGACVHGRACSKVGLCCRPSSKLNLCCWAGDSISPLLSLEMSPRLSFSMLEACWRMGCVSLHNRLRPRSGRGASRLAGSLIYCGSGSRPKLAAASLIPTLKLSDCCQRISREHTGSWILAGFMASQKKATFPSFPWSKYGSLTMFWTMRWQRKNHGMLSGKLL